MSLAEIKQEVAKLISAERRELELQLKVLKDLEDPAFLAELTEAHAEVERGVGEISRDAMLERLRA